MHTIFVLLLVAVLACASPSAQELIGAQPTVTRPGRVHENSSVSRHWESTTASILKTSPLPGKN